MQSSPNLQIRLVTYLLLCISFVLLSIVTGICRRLAVTFRRLLSLGVPFLGAIVYILIRAVVSKAVEV